MYKDSKNQNENSRQEYLKKIFDSSAIAADSIRRLSQELSKNASVKIKIDPITDEQFISIIFEFIYFYLHLTHRFAFDRLNEDRAKRLLEGLHEISILAAINTLMPKIPFPDKQEVLSSSIDDFQVSMKEYSNYNKIFPDKEEGEEGTLLWEFGKVVSELAGSKGELAYIMHAQELVTNSLQNLDIISFIQNTSNYNSNEKLKLSPSEDFFIKMIKKGLELDGNTLSEEEENLLKKPVLDLEEHPNFTPEYGKRLQEKCNVALSRAYSLGTSSSRKRDRIETASIWRYLNKDLYKTSTLVVSGIVQNWYLGEGRKLEKKATRLF